MSDKLRAAAEQALEALQHLAGMNCDHSRGICVCEYRDAADALRAALAQAEPVAWLCVIDEAMVVHHLGVADPTDDYETAKRKMNTLLCMAQDIGADFAKQAEPDLRFANPIGLTPPQKEMQRRQLTQRAEPVQEFRFTECVFVGPPPAPHEDWHHAISAMLREKRISGLRISTATADDWNGDKEQQRKPLTDEEIDKISYRCVPCAAYIGMHEHAKMTQEQAQQSMRGYARAIIERAHGIGKESGDER